MTNRIPYSWTCHPAHLVQLIRESHPPLDCNGYTAGITAIITVVESIPVDDPTLTDSLIRDCVIAFQDAAIARLDGDR